jgi:hypothetical protein
MISILQTLQFCFFRGGGRDPPIKMDLSILIFVLPRYHDDRMCDHVCSMGLETSSHLSRTGSDEDLSRGFLVRPRTLVILGTWAVEGNE